MGRTINILESESDPLDCVEFIDSDGDRFQIKRDDLTILSLNVDGNSIRFRHNDLDTMIKLFQAAKYYNI
jgi:hypothetical protein